jgi:2-polyprenyl-3-methyl-5-hydroxy-6-metoxy-1,4-benzoquinol methylase
LSRPPAASVSDATGEGRQPVASRYRRNYRRYGTHELIVRQVPPASVVLDVGCAAGYLGEPLRGRGCTVFGVERDPAAAAVARTSSYEDVRTLDIDRTDELPWPEHSFAVVVAADVFEHLDDPAHALRLLRRYLAPSGQLILSLPNVAHLSVRVPLLFGRFTYRPTGILDETHKRLFTFRTARELVESCGFQSERLLGASDRFGGLLQSLGPAAPLVRGLLAYSIVIVATPRP